MINRTHKLPLKRQCELLGLPRSSVYYQPQGSSEDDLRMTRRVDELHLKYPFAGSRTIRDCSAVMVFM